MASESCPPRRDHAKRLVGAPYRRVERRPARPAAWFLLAFVLMFSGAGCETASSPADGTVMRDSAGLVIVENDPAVPGWGEDGWTIDPEPILRIGAVDAVGPEQLHRVIDSRFLPRAEIAVVDGESAEVRIFARDGTWRRSIGGDGDGPGEFRSPWHVGSYGGDSLLVVDLYRAVSVFDPSGRYVRQFVPGALVGESQGPPRGQFGDGTLLFMRYQQADPAEIGIVRTEVELVRVGLDGEVLLSYGLFPEQTVRRGTGQYIFGPRAWMAPGDSMLYYAPGDRLEIRHVAPTGQTTRLVRLEVEPRPITQAHRDAWMAMLVESNPNMPEELFDRMFADVQSPESFPSHGQILVDDRENLWVRDFEVPGDSAPARWFVFDHLGRYLGELATPAGLTVQQIAGDRLLGRWRDDMGVEYVHVYRIRGRGSP